MGITVKIFDASFITNVLSFADDDSVLVTSTGRFSLRYQDVITLHSSERDPKLGDIEVAVEVDRRLGFEIDHDDTWITAGGREGLKLLWLPPRFRPETSAILSKPPRSVVAIGCPSGGVVIMGPEESSFSDGV